MSADSPIPGPSRPMEIARLKLVEMSPDAPLSEVFRQACEVSAHSLMIERVGIWLFIDDRKILRCTNLFERSRDEHTSGALLAVADFPTYFSSLNIRKAVPAECATTDPWTAELATNYLKPLGISSMLDAGIFVNGSMVGVVCHENVGLAREWTTEARDFAGWIADFLAMRIQSTNLRELKATFLQQKERLAELEKMSAIKQVVAGIAHDFRNLLTILVGEGELLSSRNELPSDARQQGIAILKAAERGIALVEELMNFAQPTVKPPAVTDLSHATLECLTILQAAVAPDCRIEFSRFNITGQVFLDKNQYTRALLNLVLNARDAMRSGGTITIRLRPVKIRGEFQAGGRYLLLEVSDHGIGMDEQTLKRIFEPYFTTKDKGTGLGLAVVKQVMDRAGGFIRVESTRNSGTTFRLFFPCIGASTGETSEFIVPPELRES